MNNALVALTLMIAASKPEEKEIMVKSDRAFTKQQNMSNNNTSSIVSKVWAFCNTLRDDGVGYVCLNQDFQDLKINRI